MKNVISILIIIIVLNPIISATDKSESNDSLSILRNEMVELQIKTRGITDPKLLTALLKVERHLFVPEKYRHLAYFDYPLPIDNNQTISQPYIVALMTELAQVDESDKILEVGTGSGYQAAILGELADSVFSIEIICDLAEKADTLLKKIGYENIFIMCGDGFIGWDEHAPYDAIIVTCAPRDVPQMLIEQLAENGRLVIPVGTSSQELLLITKRKEKIIEKKIIPVRFVPMTGEAEKMK